MGVGPAKAHSGDRAEDPSPVAIPRALRRLLILLAIASAVCIALALARIVYTDSSVYAFMLWNLVLGEAVFLLAERKARRRFVVPLVVLWLLFFPNAPYILTDYLHMIGPRSDAPGWYDLLLFSWFALVGFLLGAAALIPIQTVVQRRSSREVGWAAVVVVVVLAGVGVYVGRFVQWNSWDVISSPQALLIGLTGGVTHPARLIGFSVLFSLLFLVVYVAVRSVPDARE